MEDTTKYLIHADVVVSGVVERNDVVGAIFGQTDGLLGAELDLRDLRRSQKVSRIDVEITSSNGTSRGHLTIATSLDRVETATLAASLETITRVGPCRAEIEVTEIEDVRAAKRNAVVERAKELLQTGFDDTIISSEEILQEVRQHVRVEDITEYDGLPAGPRVTDSDAIILVEGRSDVLTLLQYGIKNAIGVEGTNVPDAVSELTRHRTVTAFLDGDRGGDLILEELAQVGEIDFVAFAPAGTSVEDLDHHQVFTALRNKMPFDAVSGMKNPREAIATTNGGSSPAPLSEQAPVGRPPFDGHVRDGERTDHGAAVPGDSPVGAPTESGDPLANDVGAVAGADGAAEDGAEPDGAEPIYRHASEIIRAGTERVRFLDADGEILEEADVGDAYSLLESLDPNPTAVVYDSICDQQLLDLATERGVDRIVARSLGQFTKRPTSVRIHAIDDVAESAPESA